MREQLQALIDYTGMSVRDAASWVGCSHEALSRKLAGREGYEVRDSDVESLRAVADWQDENVRKTGEIIAAAGNSSAFEIRLIVYRNEADALPNQAVPVSVTRMVAARLRRLYPRRVRTVIFDRDDYDNWRGVRADTQEARIDWANDDSRNKEYRLGIKWGVDTTTNNQAIGWAMLEQGQGKVIGKKGGISPMKSPFPKKPG